MPQDSNSADAPESPVYFTARHLLEALNALDDGLLDLPLILIHGKDLHKPNLVHGWVPAPTPVVRNVVEGKNASILTIANIVDRLDDN